MQCPNCDAAVLVGDKFCEECGTPLTASKPPTANNSCEKCGAGIEAIDAEGYCTNCGFRQVAPERERLEVVINLNLAGVSDRGLRHHRNEDYLALQQVNNSQMKSAEYSYSYSALSTQHSALSKVNILVVCDGVSNSEEPDIAARTAAESACTTLATVCQQGEKPESAIKSAFVSALASVCKIPYKQSINSDTPSTTMVAAVVQNHIATIGWLGDSRAYWISANACQQLTQDDSWLAEVVATGQMTEAEARKSPDAHAITRWLGADVDEDAIPSIVNFTIPSSGYLLLCTDGLWNYAPQPEQLANLIQKSSTTDAISISRSLVEFAKQSGGHDNITVAVLALD